MPAKPSIWDYLPRPEETAFRRENATTARLGPAIGSTTTAMTRFPFGTKERDYLGWLPAQITLAVPKSVINTIASMVCHARRKGRKEAYNFLKQFVLEHMRMPDWRHYPVNGLQEMTPPPLPPTQEM